MTNVARAELAAALERIPRVALAALPTPLDAAPRLAAALDGPDIWIKRDDLTGLCFGGNKTRQLEFVFADLLAKGCDTVVAGATRGHAVEVKSVDEPAAEIGLGELAADQGGDVSRVGRQRLVDPHLTSDQRVV